MVARVTLAEIDTIRLPLEKAIEIFEESILPTLHERDGYEGCYAFSTPEGRVQVVTFWRDAEAADVGVASGYYDEQVAKFVAVFRAPAGRELYDVVVADTPAAAIH